jgi:hypothetical protein
MILVSGPPHAGGFQKINKIPHLPGSALQE